MDKVRIGVIGVGGMGYSHSKAVKSLAETELTCVSDMEEAVAKEKGEEFGVGYFTDYRELIKSGLCDAVIVATPHWIHPEISVFAFDNGLHVLSEKPLAVTVSGADEMIDAAKRNARNRYLYAFGRTSREG
jgi:predicted dehydrogenase